MLQMHNPYQHSYSYFPSLECHFSLKGFHHFLVLLSRQNHRTNLKKKQSIRRSTSAGSKNWCIVHYIYTCERNIFLCTHRILESGWLNEIFNVQCLWNRCWNLSITCYYWTLKNILCLVCHVYFAITTFNKCLHWQQNDSVWTMTCLRFTTSGISRGNKVLNMEIFTSFSHRISSLKNIGIHADEQVYNFINRN